MKIMRFVKNLDGKIIWAWNEDDRICRPFRWNPPGGYWRQCDGEYSLSYTKQMVRMGLIKFVPRHDIHSMNVYEK